MKTIRIILLSLVACVLFGCGAKQQMFQNPLFPKCGPDPWAYFYNGNYYYMHTMGDRLNLWVTPDITDVRNAPCKTIWIPTDSTNMFDVWAPEIHRVNNKWYVYYAADDGNTDNHQLYVLENENEDPFEGEFVMKGRISTDPDNNWAIDGSVFEVNDELYMVWSGWQTRRVSTETQCIYIAKMANPWTLGSERVMISKPELEWERHWVNENGWTPPYTIYVNEGPQPLLSPDGQYVHVAYSASGCWTPYYALGLLTARIGSDLLDTASWSKSQQPVFGQKPEVGVYGTGHNSFFPSPDGKEWYILYHARSTETDPAGEGDTRSPRMQKMDWKDGYPVLGEPLPAGTWLPKPSGTPDVKKTWKPLTDKIMTTWGEMIDPENVLGEYPRPQLVRADWQSLNGLWQYAFTQRGSECPVTWQGQILVPFAVESSLSGVGKSLYKNEELWYYRTFSVPCAWRKERVMLNFGAVDWQAEVYVNGQLAGSHTGGYTPFSIDITPYLSKARKQELAVRVIDSSDKSFQPCGKQAVHPNGIWYTSVTGIWQTVWMEPVADNYITAVVPTADIDNNVLKIQVKAEKEATVRVTVKSCGEMVAVAEGISGTDLALTIENAQLWSPESPYLYDVEVELLAEDKIVDQVQSYAAMRKISKQLDAQGLWRMQLNNQDYFQYGPLDQGWWPDGLYTAPSDEALVYDIQKTKEWGFNMIRKHVKVEPSRWYYYCDKMGMLVWQDMPSGDMGNVWENHTYGGTDKDRTDESKANYYKEWKDIMEFCKPFACVVVWVPFNEAWGQFETETVAEWTKQQDPTRLVNSASGGNFRKCGDILDLHNYPAPAMYLFDAERVNVLGEYGGIGLPIEGHLWSDNKNWGYIKFTNSDEVTAEYVKYANILKDFIAKGFSAAVYTQTTDVEGEVNGLMTYDRKVIKINEDVIRQINQEIISCLQK